MEEPISHHAYTNPEWTSANHEVMEDASVSQQQQVTLHRYSVLPWELRHHVHTFCVQGSYDNEVIVRRGTNGGLTLLVRQSSGPHSYQWIVDPVLQHLGPDRIGLAAAREILGVYYRARIFKFTHREFDALRLFLENESGLGIRTADLVRRLHLQIQPFMYAQLREREAKNQQERTCRNALKSLLAIQSPSTTIEIHADLSQGFCDDEEYDELLKDAAGFVFRTCTLVNTLRKNGLKVEMKLAGGWDGKNETSTCSGSQPSLQDFINLMRVACP